MVIDNSAKGPFQTNKKKFVTLTGRGPLSSQLATELYLNWGTAQGPVSQKSRNFSGLFRVPQLPLYLRNAEVLSLQTAQSSCRVFLILKTRKKISFSKQADCSFTARFSDPKRSRDFRETGPR